MLKAQENHLFWPADYDVLNAPKCSFQVLWLQSYLRSSKWCTTCIFPHLLHSLLVFSYNEQYMAFMNFQKTFRVPFAQIHVFVVRKLGEYFLQCKDHWYWYKVSGGPPHVSIQIVLTQLAQIFHIHTGFHPPLLVLSVSQF